MGFQNVLISAVTLLAFAVPGFFLRRFKIFDGRSVKVLVALLVFVAQPAMVGESILKQKFSSELGKNLLLTMGIYVLVVALIFVVGALIFRQRSKKSKTDHPEIGETDRASKLTESGDLLGETVRAAICAKPKGIINPTEIDSISAPQDIVGEQKCGQKSNAAVNNRVYRFASMFGNNGYFGLPLIALLFPDNKTMLLYASLCVVLFNILTWTVGIFILTGDKKYISLKKGLLLPVPIVAALTLPFFFLKSLAIPVPILTFFNGLGTMTTPLSMLIMGARLAEIPLKELFADSKVYVVSALRLIAAPALTFCLLKLFGITDAELFNTLMIVSLVPSAVTTIVLSEKFLTNSVAAVRAVLLTTVLCIITIPLLCAFLLI